MTIITDNPHDLTLGRSFLFFGMYIMIAGFLIKPSFSFIVAGIIIVIKIIICYLENFLPNIISLTIFLLIAFITWFFAINFDKSIKGARESEKKLRSIFESIPDLFLLLKSDSTILEHKGYDPKFALFYKPEYLGTKATNFLPPQIGKTVSNIIQKVIKKRKHQIYEYVGKNLTGDLIGQEALFLYISQETVALFLRDITLRKRLELELRKALKNYRRAYRRESFYKDLFAHDMNNILQGILLSLEIFESEKKNTREQNENEMVTLIKEQINRGARLVQNVRRFSDFDESPVELKELDVIKVLEQAIKEAKACSNGKKITVPIESFEKRILIKANEFLLDVFKNLLMNSIIHNENQSIEISIKISRIQKNEKGFLKVEFIDNGMGIPNSKKEYIFNRGFKGDKSLNGLGLGLSLVKGILKTYNAQIWVEDKIPEDYSKGCNFIILFPDVC
jgi:signal transduction histidine kinase